VTTRRNRLRVNLLIHLHTAGLRHDLQVWRRALQASGVQSTITAFHRRLEHRVLRAVRKLKGRISPRPPFDVNIFVEDIEESWCSLAHVNVFVPHQEWVFDDLRAKLPLMDSVFCKTHYAAHLFDAIGPDVRYVGFTSVDRYDPAVQKGYSQFLHVAGSSHQKGTGTINELWLRHPEWPRLTLCAFDPAVALVPAPNITTVTTFLEESAVRRLQNAIGIHLCPSETEGFGHYIVEAMSTGACIVTTDAPPMNELIGPDRGALAGYVRTEPQGMSTNYYVGLEGLERAVDRLLGMDEAARRTLGENAKAWFHINDREFLTRFRERLLDAASSKRRAT